LLTAVLFGITEEIPQNVGLRALKSKKSDIVGRYIWTHKVFSNI
jgi:hypothetical protein